SRDPREDPRPDPDQELHPARREVGRMPRGRGTLGETGGRGGDPRVRATWTNSGPREPDGHATPPGRWIGGSRRDAAPPRVVRPPSRGFGPRDVSRRGRTPGRSLARSPRAPRGRGRRRLRERGAVRQRRRDARAPEARRDPPLAADGALRRPRGVRL